jgi:tripartite-type tricarboxylate transporter receptor subunit TctC
LKKRRIFIFCCAALWPAFVQSSEAAQPPNMFYAGKTVTLVVGSDAGGIFDLGGRIMAAFLTKYIPGRPTVVVQNMPGASSVVAATYLYSVAPRDGLTIGAVQPLIVLNKSQRPELHYEPQRFTWLGRLQPIVFAGIGWRASGLDSIEDAKKKTAIVSAQGADGISAITPWALNKLAGTKFRVVTGYKSESAAFLAMEHGEVQGIGSAALTDVLEKPDWSRNQRVSILYTITSKRSSLSPQAPAIPELAGSEDDRKALTLIGEGMDVGQSLLAPPGIPVDRRDVLRSAFDAMLKDPALAAQANKVGISIEPLSGSDLSKLVTSVIEAPPATIERMREATRRQ